MVQSTGNELGIKKAYESLKTVNRVGGKRVNQLKAIPFRDFGNILHITAWLTVYKRMSVS